MRRFNLASFPTSQPHLALSAIVLSPRNTQHQSSKFQTTVRNMAKTLFQFLLYQLRQHKVQQKDSTKTVAHENFLPVLMREKINEKKFPTCYNLVTIFWLKM